MTLHITAQFPDNAKARIRTALKLLGASAVRIEETATAPSVKLKPDTLPTSEAAKAVATLFHRSHDKEWADEEIVAFKKAVKTGLLTLENMKIVTAFYLRERKQEKHFCRTSILTFCRHFGTELDKARASKPEPSKKGEWLDSNKVVPMTPDADAEEIRRKAKEQAALLRQQINERTA